MGRGVSVVSICILLLGYASQVLAGIPKPRNDASSASPTYNAKLLSPIFQGMDAAPFHGVLKAYYAGDIALAIAEIERLRKGPKPVAEGAAFFLGELYLKQAEQGEGEAISQAMASFEGAIQAYPKSKHVSFGYLQIGKIYARQRLFYEAIGSFERILKRPHSDPFRWKAGLEMAKTYRAWEKWLNAKATYETILGVKPLPIADKSEVLFGYADVLYQVGQFERAYQYYREAAAMTVVYRFRDPLSLFQYGEAAYRAGYFAQAKQLLLDFYNIHPNAPLASVALIRAGAIFQREAKSVEPMLPLVTPDLASRSSTFRSMTAKPGEESESFHLGRILLSVEALKECGSATRKQLSGDPFLADNAILCDMPLVREGFLRSPQWSALRVEEIRTHAKRLVQGNRLSTTAQGVLLEAIHQLQKQRALDAIVEIEAGLLLALPSVSPYRSEVQQMLDETIVKQWAPQSDPTAKVTFFHAYSPAFTSKMLKENIGFIMGMSHVQVGLLSKGAAILQPVANNFKHPHSDEALYQLGQIFLQLGEDERAKQAFEQYQLRSNSGRYRALADLGDIAFKNHRIDEAVRLYQHWLKHHPNNSMRGEVYLKLSDVHRFRNDFDNEITVYLKWMQDDPQSGKMPYLRLSDAYFQSGQYEKAAVSYQWILDNAKEGNKIEWVQLRLGQAYALMGDPEKGMRLFTIISKNGKDPLIRRMATEQLRAIVGTTSLQDLLPAENERL